MRYTSTAISQGVVNGLVTSNPKTFITYAEAVGVGTAIIYEGIDATGKELTRIEAPCKISFDTPVRAIGGVFVVNGGATVIIHLG